MTSLKKLTVIALPLLLIACGNDDLDPDAVNIPDVYEFISLTDPSAVSSVDYKEATTRLVLIKELEYLINSDYLQNYGVENGEDAAMALLNRVYESGTKSNIANNLAAVNLYDDTSTPTPINSINFSGDTELFDTLAVDVNLKEVMPGFKSSLPVREVGSEENNGDFIGWEIDGLTTGGSYPNALIQNWFKEIAILATDTNIEGEYNATTKYLKNNINYRNLIISFLTASIPYNEVSNFYLNDQGLTANNSRDDSSLPYTQLEHNWDIAFGYFGTLITAKNESYDSIIAAHEDDVTQISEQVFTIAASAALRDKDSPFSTSSLSNSFITNSLIGRNLISQNKTSTLSKYSQITLDTWERTLAAALAHHINATIGLGFSANPNEWAHMKAYALALQFNPNAILAERTLLEIHTLIGTNPVISNKNYLQDILDARGKIQSTYSFPLEDVQSW